MKEKTAINPPCRRQNYIIFTIAVFAAYAFFGFSENAKGPAIPRIQADFNITELQLGLLFAANAAGYLIACMYTAALAKKIGIKTCMLIALCVIAVSGIFICFSGGYLTLLAAFFVLNLGNGMLEISLSVIAAATFTKNTGAMMNLAHFFYGAGAVFSPVVSAGLMAASFGSNVFGWRYMYLAVLGMALIPAVIALIGRLEKKDYNKKKTGYAVILRNPTLWLTVMIFTPGAICEMGVGAWLVNYLEKACGYSAESAALSLTLFFVCFTLTRLIIGPVIDKVGFINSLAVLTAFAGIMIVIGVLRGEAGVTLLIIAGIGIAPVFPTVMAVVSKLFSEELDVAVTSITTVTGILTIPANLLLGGIIQLARTAFASTAADAGVGAAYSAGYLFLGLCCFVSAAAATVLRSRQKKIGRLV
ncbi:MAG: MFS transporter [Oscillospiraceae bacterium]|nr:MFS transporter [Oscillospiraceae bacterium]